MTVRDTVARSGQPACQHGIKNVDLRPTVGFEPTTTGLQNRCSKDTTSELSSICDDVIAPLTPQLTPESPRQGEIGTSRLPSDLAEIVKAWPELPEHIKAAFKALIQTCGAEGK